jgi:hypothetical protein
MAQVVEHLLSKWNPCIQNLKERKERKKKILEVIMNKS